MVSEWTSTPSRFTFAAMLALAFLLGGCDEGANEVASGEAYPAVTETQATADPSVVTEESVYENEDHWPSIVALTEAWRPDGAPRDLQAGYRGALVRVTEDGDPRIDFGRHGKHVVPVEVTDLVAQTNAVRRGETFKGGPNFVRQIGTRLLSIDQGEPRAIMSAEIENAPAYLCVFADPRAEDFHALARQIAEETEATSIQAIFFPQAVDRMDLPLLRDALATADWIVPFAYPRLSADYTQSILGAEVPAPAVLLLSPEGRILYRAGLDSSLDGAAIRAVVGSRSAISRG